MSAYLPVYCDFCARASLAAFEDGQLRPCCAFCEAPARVVPGPIYGDADWLAFADIDAALSEAELAGATATALADELQHLMDIREAPQDIVKQMVTRLPPLTKARPALVNGLTRGTRMLMTLLGARTRGSVED